MESILHRVLEIRWSVSGMWRQATESLWKVTQALLDRLYSRLTTRLLCLDLMTKQSEFGKRRPEKSYLYLGTKVKSNPLPFRQMKIASLLAASMEPSDFGT